MIKKIILSTLIGLTAVFAQSNQSVELPNFVITGVRTVDIKTMNKKSPELISTLSKEFILPTKSPETFKISILSKISAPDTNIHVVNRDYNGFLNVGVGINTLPVGDLRYTLTSRHVMLNAKVFGQKDRDYEDNSGYNVSGASVNTDFFISSGSQFLPGLRLGLNAGFIRDDYKFFGSATPTTERKTQNMFGSAKLIHNLGGYNFGLELSGRMFELENIKLEEKYFDAKAFVEFNISRFAVRAAAEYRNQGLTNNLTTTDSYDYLAGMAFAKIDLSKDITLKGGASYAKSEGSNLFSPYASIKLKFTKEISLFGEFNPGTEFLTMYDFVKSNRYFNLATVDNVFTKHKIRMNATLKYEFEKYVEAGITGNYSKSDNYSYFADNVTGGFFNINTADDVENFNGGIYAIFHLGPMGKFYGSVNFASSKFSNDKYVPYHPKGYGQLSYFYEFTNGIEINPKVLFATGSYTDAANTNELDSYIDLGLTVKYKLLKNLSVKADFNNIINSENYIYKGYKEKPLDIILGIEYRW